MNKLEDIKALELKISECEKKQADLRGDQYELETAREELVRQVILENGMLNGTEWTVKLYKSTLYLEYKYSIESAEMSAVTELCRSGWHSSFELDKDIEFQFDDMKLSIRFDDHKLIKKFISDHKLVITEEFSKDIAALRSEINTLETLFDAMK
jgi:hypothetical protein